MGRTWRTREHSRDRKRDDGDPVEHRTWTDDDEWGIAISNAQDGHQDNEFLVSIGLGTPAQPIKMVLDSGSSGGWSYSTHCCYSSNHSYFDPTKSSTYSNRTLVNGTAVRSTTDPGTEFDYSYGSGSDAIGYLGFDTMTIGSQLVLPNMTIGLTTNITGSSRISRQMEGIVGLMPSSILAYTGGYNVPFEQAQETKKLQNPYITATLVKANRTTGEGGGGRYVWGDVDRQLLAGELSWQSVVSTTYWGLVFDSLSLGNGSDAINITDPTDTQRRLIVDTGSALISLSSEAADSFNNRISGSVKRDTTRYTSPWVIPCSTGLPEYEATLPSANKTQPFYITLGGDTFGVPIEDFVFWPLSPLPTTTAASSFLKTMSSTNSSSTTSEDDAASEMCLSAFQPASAGFTVLGDTFIKNAVVVFDEGSTPSSSSALSRRVGFGRRLDVTGV